VGQHGFTAAQTQSFNAGFILIFAPVFATLWTVLAKRGKMTPTRCTSSALALIQVGLGFLVVVWAAAMADGASRCR
jgi:POT family proton-dependent oligopeptide transporter